MWEFRQLYSNPTHVRGSLKVVMVLQLLACLRFYNFCVCLKFLLHIISSFCQDDQNRPIQIQGQGWETFQIWDRYSFKKTRWRIDNVIVLKNLLTKEKVNCLYHSFNPCHMNNSVNALDTLACKLQFKYSSHMAPWTHYCGPGLIPTTPPKLSHT